MRPAQLFALTACVTLLSAASLESRAAACSPPPVGYFVASPGELVTISVEGALLLDGYAYYGDIEPSVTVRDGEGAPVAGTLRRFNLRTGAEVHGLGHGESSELVVWQPDAPLRPGSEYRGVVEFGYSYGEELESFELAIAVTDTPLPTRVSPVIDALEARLERVSRNLEQRCPEPMFPGECPMTNCEYVDLEDMVTVSFTLPARYDDPHVFYRLVAEGDGVIARAHRGYGGGIGDGGRELRVHYVDRQDEYCATLESVSVLDGTVLTSERACIQDAFVNELREEPGVAVSGSGCSVQPGGAATGAPLGLLALGLLFLRRRLG